MQHETRIYTTWTINGVQVLAATEPIQGCIHTGDRYNCSGRRFCQLSARSHLIFPCYIPEVHRGVFFQFPFRWIYYYVSNKSTEKETGKSHLCAVGWWIQKVQKCIDVIYGWSLDSCAVTRVSHQTGSRVIFLVKRRLSFSIFWKICLNKERFRKSYALSVQVQMF